MKALYQVSIAALVAAIGLIAGAAAQTPISTSSATPKNPDPLGGGVRTPPPPTPPARIRVDRATLAPLTEQLVDWLIAELDSAVAIGRLGEEQSSNRRVRNFASDVLDEQEALLDELVRLRGGRRARVVAGVETPENSVPADDKSKDQVEAPQTRPVESSKTAASGSGQESGFTGVRSRDVAPGETGANRSVGGGDKQPGDHTTANPKNSEPSSGKTTIEEMRERDRRLDAFDRAGQAGTAKQAEQLERQKIRTGQDSDSVRKAREPVVQLSSGIGEILQEVPATWLAIVRRDLENASDDEFDEAFLNHEIQLQLHLLSVFRSINRHSSAELRGISADGAHLSRKYLDSARGILARL